MFLSLTAISYLIGLTALVLLTWRFFYYAKRENTVTSRMFLYFGLSFTVFLLITFLCTAFFYESVSVLRFVIVTAAFFQGLGMSFLGYLIVFLKVKSISPKFGFGAIFLLTLVSTSLAIVMPYEPVFNEAALSIDWGVPFAVSIPRALAFLLTFIPMGYIFFQQSLLAKERYLKIRELGLGLVMLLAFVAGFIDFILEQLLHLGPASSDYAFSCIFGMLVFIIVFTQTKVPSYVKKV